MGPLGRQRLARRLAGASAPAPAGEAQEPVRVAVLTTLVSPSLLVSPLTGARAAILVIEIVERIALSAPGQDARSASRGERGESLGFIVLGDVVTFRDEDGDEIALVVRRARVEPALAQHGGTPLSRAPAEVVPLLRRASGRGVVCYRELALVTGAVLRINAIVEPARSLSGSRSGARVTYVARDDLAPVVLEEIGEPSTS